MKGLSTSILADGLHDRGGPDRLETVDIDELTSPIARANFAGRPGEDRVTFTLQDATDRLDGLIAERRQFGFVFVDHWHGYDATYEAAVRLPKLLPPGAYVMFHDFFDPGNSDPNHDYGVHQAVVTAFGADPSFVFVGGVGGSAILQRR
jgi:predicted O-methyltransferase YrrM